MYFHVGKHFKFHTSAQTRLTWFVPMVSGYLIWLVRFEGSSSRLPYKVQTKLESGLIFGPTVLEPEAVHRKFLRSDLEFWVPIFIFKKLEPGVSSRLTSGSWFARVSNLGYGIGCILY
jgi:hypothetical protein